MRKLRSCSLSPTILTIFKPCLKANNIPNKAEAEHWYKKWYELAAQSGLEMDSGRLQRLINAMH